MTVRRLINLLGLALFVFTTTFTARATTTKIELILSADAARPGDTITAGLRMKMQPTWHTYWRNPGGPGIPTKIIWTLPPGITAGDIQWPIPEVIFNDPFYSYAFEDEIMLLVPLKIDAAAKPGQLNLKANVTWQECAKICISGEANLSASLEIASEARPSFDAADIELAKTKLPQLDSKISITAHWEAEAEKRPLVLEWSTTNQLATVDFLPYSADGYEVQGEVERLPDTNGKITIRKLVTAKNSAWPKTIEGLWLTKEKTNGPARAYEITISTAAYIEPQVVIPKEADKSLIYQLGIAFLGGLLLNIMPCVLPVIALKVLGFVSQAKEAPVRVRTLGLVYGFGVLVSFMVLAIVAIAIQRAGGLASWSSAFQNPQFRVIITTVITLVALNLFGVFEINLGGSAMGAAGELTAKKGASGAFFNGVLATLLATPCTAPYLAGALGFAFTQPPLIIVLIFLTVGIGLAAPFVLLCWQPAWLKFLPKPGMWMVRFKVAMGFPMLATAMWLFWLTATRMGKTGVLWFGLFLIILALALWIWGEFAQRGTKRTSLAMLISLLLAGGAYGFALEHKLDWRSPQTQTENKKNAIDWQIWSASAVEKARSEGHPVLVDFTADTCLNCQLNKARSIDISVTREKLKQINAVTLEADYTDANEAIAKELKRFGQAGVPLVLVYPADKTKAPIVMPTLFSKEEMLDALGKVSK